MELLGKTLVVQNSSTTQPCDDWASLGIPESTTENLAAFEGTTEYPVFTVGKELFVKVPLLADGAKTLTLGQASTSQIQRGHSRATRGAWRDIVGQTAGGDGSTAVNDPEALGLALELTYSGTTYTLVPTFQAGVRQGPRERFQFNEKFAVAKVLVKGWIDLFDDQQTVEYQIRASYGTTTPSLNSRAMGALRLRTLAKATVDHRVFKGLAAPAQAGGYWFSQLVPARNWFRCETFRRKGGILRDPAKEAQRLGGKTYGVVTDVWDGWLPGMGGVPRIASASQKTNEISAFMGVVAAREAQVVGDDTPTFYGQQLATGTAGTNIDFGVTSRLAGLIIDGAHPKALHYVAVDIDTWIRRAYAHREEDGSRIDIANHADVQFYDSRTYQGGTDTLGWEDFGYHTSFPTWHPEKNTHRSNNLNHLVYALTRDPALLETLQDQAVIDQRPDWRFNTAPWAEWPNLTLGQGAADGPRLYARPLYTMCARHQLGVANLEQRIRDMVHMVTTQAEYNNWATTVDIQTYTRVGYASGSNYPVGHPSAGQPIRGWQPWMELLMAQGLYVAWKLFGIPEALDGAVRICRTIVNWGLFRPYQQATGPWGAGYLIEWQPNAAAPPASAYWWTTPSQTNYVVVDANADYILQLMGAVRILHAHEPSARTAELIATFGNSPNWEWAAWQSITPGV